MLPSLPGRRARATIAGAGSERSPVSTGPNVGRRTPAGPAGLSLTLTTSLVLAVLGGGAVTTSGCFTPQLDPGQFTCRTSDECPHGFICSGEPRYACVIEGEPFPDLGPPDFPTDAPANDIAEDPDAGLQPSQIPVQVAMGRRHSCARMQDDTVRCWGDNTAGQLGTGDTMPRTRPTFVPNISVPMDLSLGLSHTCSVTTGRPPRALCWGSSSRGQLGNAVQAGGQSSTPVAVDGVAGIPARIEAAEEHTCALSDDGSASCWGSNLMGELGTGQGPDRATPQLVTLRAPVTSLSSTTRHTCAALNDGSVWCWGANDSDQLGRTGPQSPVPVQVLQLTGAAQVHVGQSHSCAMQGDDTVRCWGADSDGQLGDGLQVTRPYDPQMVGDVGLQGVQALVTGYRHNCVSLGPAGMSCWGANDHGQMGQGASSTQASYNRPVALDLMAANLASKGEHTCAIVGQRMYCWGQNDYGQLGDGTSTDRDAPTPIDFPLP
jgi:alpha-tubulin suppressor-like RCC1 family protein